MSKAIDYRDLFLTTQPLEEHVKGYEHDLERYMATYMLLLNSDVHMAFEVKELLLSTLLIFKNEGAINYLFSKPFWTILDIRNVIRRVWTTKAAKSNRWLRREMRNGRQIKLSRRDILKYQIEKMDAWKIERSILRHSYDAWREVIDYLHIAEKTFPDYVKDKEELEVLQVRYEQMLPDIEVPPEFNSVMEISGWLHIEKEKLMKRFSKPHSPLVKTIMDGTWPPTRFIETMRGVTNKNAAAVLMNYPTEFHYLRSKINFKDNPKIAEAFLHKCSLANIIRWYEELWWPSTMSLIETRLVETSIDRMIHQPYSLFFQLLHSNQSTMSEELKNNLITRADLLTSRFNLPYEEPGLIAVDQSSSMSDEQVQIGTIIANLIGKQLNADLVYFHGGWNRGYGRSQGRDHDGWSGNIYKAGSAIAEYEDVPLGTAGSLELIDQHSPIGNTPIAQILARYMTPTGHLIEGAKRLKTIVLVTDEGENGHWGGMYIAEALRKYRELIGEGITVLVIAIQSDSTIVTESLQGLGFPVIRYKIDSVRHIESLFAMIAANTPAFLYDQTALAIQLRLRKRELMIAAQLKGDAAAVSTAVYMEADNQLFSYKKKRDEIFASVIKGTCFNCGANLSIKDVNRFRFGETIKCGSCDFSLAPTLFGATHVPK